MGAPDTAFVKQFGDTITLLAQQLESRLMACAMQDNDFKGEAKFYDQYASEDMTEQLSRYADTPIGSPDHRRRRITPRYFVANTLIDPKDSLQMLVDPASAMLQSKKAAAARKWDDLIIAALGGSAWTGKDGTVEQTLVAYDSGSHVIAYNLTAATGMSKAKAIRAKKLLDKDEVDKEDRFIAFTSAQLEDLLNTTEVTSIDFNTVRSLVEGEIDKWLGFNWIRTERLVTNSSSRRRCYAWQKKGVQVAKQKEVEARIDPRPDKSYCNQVFIRMCGGATRLEEARVVEIVCAES